MTTELEDFILTKPEVAVATKRNYRNQYNRIRQSLKNDIINSSEEEILAAAKIVSNDNPSCEWTYLNLPFMIRQTRFFLSNDLIQQRRSELKILRDNHTLTQKVEKNDTLPNMKTVQDFTKQLFQNKEFKRYIVNFLLINYGVRNKDINVFIVGSKADAKYTEINYLIVKKNEVEWIRNDYKTVATYGPKNIIIKSKPFIEAIKTVPLNSWLLTDFENKLNDTSIATTIKRLLYDNLAEGDYFKIILNDINTKPNTTQLLQYYSNMRGTDLKTLLKYYDLAPAI